MNPRVSGNLVTRLGSAIGPLAWAGVLAVLRTCLVVLLVEAALRPAAWLWYGRSQYYLFFGIHSLVGRVGIGPMSTFQGEYYKFPPLYQLQGAAGQAAGETASVNNLGFRGPDFTPAKPPSVFRVVCLGESSTFGYRDGDNETYPFYLQTLFERDGLPVQVINAGFPYYNTGSILSLLQNEILTYSPDLITLYAGYNDTSWPTEINLAGRILLWVQGHSITYLIVRRSGFFTGDTERSFNDRLIPQKLRQEALRKNEEQVAQRYRTNLQAIIDLARRRGIAVVLIKQPVTRGERYLSMTYEEENRRIRRKFERGRTLKEIENWMMKQYRLMGELDQIARELDLPVVDNIRIVDQDRRRFASWVHLTPEANLRLAEALKATITPYVLKARGTTAETLR
jgi:lysophospholipase L1-like esterase